MNTACGIQTESEETQAVRTVGRKQANSLARISNHFIGATYNS